MEEQNYKNIYAIIAFLGREGLLDYIHNVTDDFFIYSVSGDPDDAEPQSLLICEEDIAEDGLDGAADSGVRCYISERIYDSDIPAIIVKDAAEASARVREFIGMNKK